MVEHSPKILASEKKATTTSRLYYAITPMVKSLCKKKKRKKKEIMVIFMPMRVCDQGEGESLSASLSDKMHFHSSVRLLWSCQSGRLTKTWPSATSRKIQTHTTAFQRGISDKYTCEIFTGGTP